MKDIGDAIKGLLKRPRLRDGLRAWTTGSLWSEVVGSEIAKHSRVVSINCGRMVVIVPSGPWAHQLTLNRDRIMTDLNAAAESAGGALIKNLVFKVGTMSPEPSAAGEPGITERPGKEHIYYSSSWEDDFAASLKSKAEHDPIARRIRDILGKEKKRLKQIKKAGGRRCAACGVWHTGRTEECVPCRVLRLAGLHEGGD